MKRWMWIALGVLVLLGILAVPGYALFKTWRATNLAQEALALAEEPDGLERAWKKASSAYYLAADNLTVVRALAEVYEMADPAQALEHWERAVELSEGAEKDRIALARVSLAIGDLERVEKQLEALRVGGETSPEVAKLEARVASQGLQFGKALDALEPFLEGSDEAIHALYLQASLASEDAAVSQRGLDHVVELAGRDDDLGLDALRLLLGLREKSGGLVTFLEERLTAHPGIIREDRLSWLAWKLRSGLMEPQAVVNAARGEFDLESDEERIALAKWLNRNGFATEVTRVVSVEAARERRDLFLVLMDAMAVQGRWEEIRRILESDGVPLENYLKQVFLARAYYETGMERRAQLGWKRVHLEIANDPVKLSFLANYARRLQLYDVAREAYERLLEIPVSRREGYLSLVKMERELQDTDRLRGVLESMHAVYPEDRAVENDLYYTQLLLGESWEVSLSGARALVEQNPNYLSHKMTLALGLLLGDRPEEALAVFDTLQIPIQQLSKSYRIILGGVLRANGLGEQADVLFRGVDPRGLLPEETELFEVYAAGSAFAP